MKRIKILMSLFLLGSVLSSCEVESHGKAYDYDRGDYMIIVIDDCEYIKFTDINQEFLAHKGNCKNPIHCHNK